MIATSPEKMALFPLGRPIYPGTAMKLRIFEQRYLKLVRESMRSGTPFGVVPIVSGREVGAAPEFFHWGTAVNITDFDQQPDGLLGITISGDRRFSVQGYGVEEDGLIVAEIEMLEGESAEACTTAEQDLLSLLTDLVNELKVDDVFPPQEPNLSELSWRLATLLPLPPDVKMSLLKEGDPHIRLDIIRECLVDMSARDKPLN